MPVREKASLSFINKVRIWLQGWNQSQAQASTYMPKIKKFATNLRIKVIRFIWFIGKSLQNIIMCDKKSENA